MQTLGEEIIAWIEMTCRVPEGVLVGEPIALMDWQRDAIRKTYDNPHGTTRRCIISVGRKSGKTTFASCLLLVPSRRSGGDPEFAALFDRAVA
jgi:phage terminase large subunit-like protein